MSAKTGRAEKGIPNALARFGFFARGTVYVVVGGLAGRVAILQRGRTLGPADALAAILAGWNGRLALWIVAAGLLAFVLFRAAQCLRTRSRLARIGYAAGALGGLFLAATAVRVLLHFHAGGDAGALREAATRLVSRAWGRGALELGGAIAAVVGALEALRAAVGRLPADFTAAIMDRDRKRWTSALARAGVFAHGAVVAVTGYSIFRAGLAGNPRGLGDTAAALRTIRHAENGPALFALAAAGLIAYGLSLFVLAAHRLKRSR
ncbi:MAG TPA: DUF1206 domain-containing protein [Thermoanaerobaculia bacterium]|nr:DUF1206 domain-containing protein [Thermoanaerobaculia bacterium]